MALAGGVVNGVAQAMGGFSLCGYSEIRCEIRSLAGPPVGGIDSLGNYAHFRYSAIMPKLTYRTGTTNNTAAADWVPPELVVEFDADSCFWLPYPGTLQIVGGSGQYLAYIAEPRPIDPRYYKPKLRTLRTFVQAGSNFTVPNGHSLVSGTNSLDQFRLPTGDVQEPNTGLPGMNVSAGQILVPVKDTTIVTGVWV